MYMYECGRTRDREGVRVEGGGGGDGSGGGGWGVVGVGDSGSGGGNRNLHTVCRASFNCWLLVTTATWASRSLDSERWPDTPQGREKTMLQVQVHAYYI